MKYTNKILGMFLATSLLLAGCESFLDEKNYSSQSIETAKSSEETLNQLVASVYERAREYSTHYTSDLYYQLEDLGTDIVTRNNAVIGTNDINDYVNLNSTNWAIGVYWDNQYAIIAAANVVIDNAGDIEGADASNKTTGIGEAKFFRAMSYFNLTENYGGVPLVLNQVTTATTQYSRASEEEVYTQIVKDLNDALSAVPENPEEYGRVSKDAVRHLLSKVLLTRGYKSFATNTDFTEAASLAETIISHHALVSSFSNLVSINNQRNSEVFFAYLFGSNPVSRGWGNSKHMLYKFRFYDYPGLSRTVQGLKSMPTPFYYSLFEDNDQRAKATFSRVNYATEAIENAKVNGKTIDIAVGDTVIYFPKVAWSDTKRNAANYFVINPDEYLTSDGITTVHYPIFTKFDDPDVPFTQPDQSSQGERDMTVMRSGEAYLIAAEAYLKASKPDLAANRLTELRTRAGLTTTVESGDVTLDFILDERARELTGEVNRWMDLKRTGKLLERTLAYNPHAKLNQALTTKHLLRPIPQEEIDNSGGSITQNPDYN